MHQLGVLTNERATVKGRRALNEMVNDLVVCHAQVKRLIPGTGIEEEERGYNKFHLGAILVRDDFSEYENMKHVHDAIHIMVTETLTGVADRVHIEQFGNYQVQFNNFCQILGDLGLYEGTSSLYTIVQSLLLLLLLLLFTTPKILLTLIITLNAVMMACRKFSDDDAVDEEDSLTEEESLSETDSFVERILLVDMKTASVFQMPLDEVMEMKLLSVLPSSSSGGPETVTIKEACDSREDREEIKQKLKNHPTLGVATRLVIQKTHDMETECYELEEKEAVANLWGVSLRSSIQKKKKNEELFFFDPETNAVGEIDRDWALKQNCITETRDEYNKVTIDQAVSDVDEWEAIIGKIRKIMGIRIGDTEETREEEPIAVTRLSLVSTNA